MPTIGKLQGFYGSRRSDLFDANLDNLQVIRASVRKHTPGPPFGAGQGWRMNDEVFAFRVIGGCGLQAPYKGSVTQLCLCIRANDLKLLSHWQPFGLLLW